MEEVLAGEKLNLKEHLSLDDTDVMFSIKQWQHSADLSCPSCPPFSETATFSKPI
jgi:hypothetical protein